MSLWFQQWVGDEEAGAWWPEASCWLSPVPDQCLVGVWVAAPNRKHDGPEVGRRCRIRVATANNELNRRSTRLFSKFQFTFSASFHTSISPLRYCIANSLQSARLTQKSHVGSPARPLAESHSIRLLHLHRLITITRYPASRTLAHPPAPAHLPFPLLQHPKAILSSGPQRQQYQQQQSARTICSRSSTRLGFRRGTRKSATQSTQSNQVKWRQV